MKILIFEYNLKYINSSNLLLNKYCECFKPIYDIYNKFDTFMMNNINQFEDLNYIKELYKVDHYKLIYNKLCDFDQLRLKLDLKYSLIAICNKIGEIKKLTVKHFENMDKVAEYIHKDTIIKPILDFSKIYFTKPIYEGDEQVINFGIIPIIKQIIIEN